MVIKKIRIVTDSIGVETRIDWEGAWKFSWVMTLSVFLDEELHDTVVCSCQNSPNCTLGFMHFTECKLYQRKWRRKGGGKVKEKRKRTANKN